MTGNIVSAVAYLQTQVAAITNMRAAPANPTNNMPSFPAAASYIVGVNGSAQSGSVRTDLFTIETQIHVQRIEIAQSMAMLQPFYKGFLDVIWASGRNLNGNVDTIVSVTGSTNMAAAWGNTDTIALVFQTIVKIIS